MRPAGEQLSAQFGGLEFVVGRLEGIEGHVGNHDLLHAASLLAHLVWVHHQVGLPKQHHKSVSSMNTYAPQDANCREANNRRGMAGLKYMSVGM